jgi:hypothetical protein
VTRVCDDLEACVAERDELRAEATALREEYRKRLGSMSPTGVFDQLTTARDQLEVELADARMEVGRLTLERQRESDRMLGLLAGLVNVIERYARNYGQDHSADLLERARAALLGSK